MTAIAASSAATHSNSIGEAACKPRANCLKPKEICRLAAQAGPGVFLTCGTGRII